MMLHKTWTKCRQWIGDSRGNVAMITAVCALPLFGFMGLAIDYALALSAKSKLDSAADAAVIAAITKAKNVLNGGGSSTAAIAQGQQQGQAVFKANAGSLPFATIPIPTVVITPTAGQTLTAKVTYSTTTQNQFGKLFNVSTTQLGGTSASSSVLTPYYQFIFVVDISGSMAIGGTTADINGLVADPNIGCAFACHDPNHNRGPDFRAIAKADGWTLKIDYVNQAIQTFIADLKQQSANLSGVFSIGIDTFASSFTVLQTPTTNLAIAQSAASQIDIESMDPLAWKNGIWDQGYTRTTASLSAALAPVTNIGDGTAPTKQMTYFIFLSDGVEDVEGNVVFGRGTDLSYTSSCAAIRAAGAQLISIVAPYPAIPPSQDPDNQYHLLIQPIASQLAPTMASCASSSSLAYVATDGPGINAAVQSALQYILQGMTRLTQ